MAHLTPWGYKAGTSPVHRLSPGLKLLLLIALSVLAFLGGIPGKLLAAGLVALGSLLARTGVRALLAGSRGLCILTLSIALLGALAGNTAPGTGLIAFGDFPVALSKTGIRAGLELLVAVLVAFSAGALLFLTTTNAGIREALAKAEWAILSPPARLLSRCGLSRMSRTLLALDLSLVIALSLGFLPRVFEVWEGAAEAWKARAGRLGIKGTIAILPIVIERLLETASETAFALEARGYRGYSTDTKPD